MADASRRGGIPLWEFIDTDTSAQAVSPEAYEGATYVYVNNGSSGNNLTLSLLGVPDIILEDGEWTQIQFFLGGWVLDSAGGGGGSDTVISATAGEDLLVNEPFYIAADGLAYKASNAAEVSAMAVGIVQADTLSGASLLGSTFGKYDWNGHGFTVGTQYYLGNPTDGDFIVEGTLTSTSLVYPSFMVLNDNDLYIHFGPLKDPADFNTLEGRVSTNETNISTNTGNISTNTGNISTNTSDIATKVEPSGTGFAVGEVVEFAGTDGKTIQTSNKTITSGGTMGADGTVLPTEDRIKSYVDSVVTNTLNFYSDTSVATSVSPVTYLPPEGWCRYVSARMVNTLGTGYNITFVVEYKVNGSWRSLKTASTGGAGSVDTTYHYDAQGLIGDGSDVRITASTTQPDTTITVYTEGYTI